MNTNQTNHHTQSFLQWGLGGFNILFFLGILTSLAFASVDIVLTEEKISATATKESSTTIISESSLIPIQQLGYITVEETPLPTPPLISPTPSFSPTPLPNPTPIVVSVKKNGSGGSDPLVVGGMKNQESTKPSFHSSAPVSDTDTITDNIVHTEESPKEDFLVHNEAIPNIIDSVSIKNPSTSEGQRIERDNIQENKEQENTESTSHKENFLGSLQADSTVLLSNPKKNDADIRDIVPLPEDLYNDEDDFVKTLSSFAETDFSNDSELLIPIDDFARSGERYDSSSRFHYAPLEKDMHSSYERVGCSWILFFLIFFLGMMAQYIISFTFLSRKYDS